VLQLLLVTSNAGWQNLLVSQVHVAYNNCLWVSCYYRNQPFLPSITILTLTKRRGVAKMCFTGWCLYCRKVIQHGMSIFCCLLSCVRLTSLFSSFAVTNIPKWSLRWCTMKQLFHCDFRMLVEFILRPQDFRATAWILVVWHCEVTCGCRLGSI